LSVSGSASVSCVIDIYEKVVEKNDTSIQNKNGNPPNFDTDLQ
jgi:hypothetical protein